MNSSIGGTQITALDPAGYRHMRWKNGGGVATDIAAAMLPGSAAGSWQGIVWRFGRTTIASAGPFSDLSGFDREMVLVSGAGLVLETVDGEIDVRQPLRPVRFAGETAITSRLEAGPVEVVNLIGDRSRVSIDLSCIAGNSSITCPAGIHILYAATAACELSIDGKTCEIAAGHALRIDAAKPLAVENRLGTAIVAGVREVRLP